MSAPSLAALLHSGHPSSESSAGNPASLPDPYYAAGGSRAATNGSLPSLQPSQRHALAPISPVPGLHPPPALSPLIQPGPSLAPSTVPAPASGYHLASPTASFAHRRVPHTPTTLAETDSSRERPSSIAPSSHGPPHLPASASSRSSQAHEKDKETQPTPVRSHASNTSLYQCADCQRRYSRPEHLARHIQTHTLGKRFRCDVCSKAFARADLLKRHAANHENDNDPSKKRRRLTSLAGASRVSHACKACAVARVKCEENKPCARCTRRGQACEYAAGEAGSAAAMHLLHLSGSSGQQQPAFERIPKSEDSHSAPRLLDPPPPAVPASSPSGSYQSSHRTSYGAAPRKEAEASPASSTYQKSQSNAKQEEAQLPTPDTVMEQGNPEQYAQSIDPNNPSSGDISRLPFSDFLRDIVYEPSMDPSRMVGGQGLAVLDFCDDSNLELNDLDFNLLDHWNIDGMTASSVPNFKAGPDEPADLANMRQSLTQVWTDSPWRWHPTSSDSGFGEQKHFSVPSGDTSSIQLRESRKMLDTDDLVPARLEPSLRDRVLAIVLSTCRNNTMVARVASSFPSVEVMDTLVRVFMAQHKCQVSGWIHFPSFSFGDQWPEWVAVVAAAGAVLTPMPTLRKFGLALQEAVRVTIPSRFEDNNTSIKNMGLIQALVLGQDIGLWSGNRRKMEIAECHLVIPITMMRYRGKFQRSSYPIIRVEASDEGAVLQDKWRAWCERESWKRLVFHCYLRDAQTSMTTLTNPSMSYSELTLPLPESGDLWFAKTAEEWKALYLGRAVGEGKRPPSVGDLIRDINCIVPNQRRLDNRQSISIYLHGFWTLILEYRQLNAVLRSKQSYAFDNSNSVLSSRHQELCVELDNFYNVASEWRGREALHVQESMLFNLLRMNLNVSLDDLQLFSGKEGDEQARRTFPILLEWSNGRDARRALWYAGQILHFAKLFPPDHLKDFYAVAVHHAALAFWAYGVMSRAAGRTSRVPMHYGGYDVIHLDGLESSGTERFITLGQGRPVIHGPEGSRLECGLEDTKGCMDIATEILKANVSGGPDAMPPIVENLCALIKQLGEAAWAVGLG